MLRLLAVGVVLLAVGSVLGAPKPGEDAKPPEVKEFLTRAIANGLTEDGVPPQFVAELAKHDDYLGKCSICGPTHQAFLTYGQRKERPAAKEGKGPPEELVTRLRSNKDDVRRPALRELVQRYVEAEYTRRDLPAAQKKALQKQLEEMRGAQANGLPAGQNFCPSCDGACGLAPKP